MTCLLYVTVALAVSAKLGYEVIHSHPLRHQMPSMRAVMILHSRDVCHTPFEGARGGSTTWVGKHCLVLWQRLMLHLGDDHCRQARIVQSARRNMFLLILLHFLSSLAMQGMWQEALSSLWLVCFPCCGKRKLYLLIRSHHSTCTDAYTCCFSFVIDCVDRLTWPGP